ncbi:ArgE/DapE family deacylase [Candidatus Chlorohelix sp.]|uniref:ArgE/DapE family deacylase n=1 Tax=Candidatus Chlorohelix sp. TaxID=3139201 RepID=UPI003024C70A
MAEIGLDKADRLTQIALNALDITGMVECLRTLIKIPSVTGSPAESDAQKVYAQMLSENGFKTDLWQIDLPRLLADSAFPGMEVEREEAWGVVGTWGVEGGSVLILNGHMDVVPPGDLAQWKISQPFDARIANNRVYGRGACDMKSGLACNLFAVKAIQAAGIKLTGQVMLQSVVGEEDGGLGTFATLRRGYRADAAVITEPTDLDIIPACAGALTFRLHLTGLSAHASMRKEGVSAIEKFWKIWQALEALETRRNTTDNSLMQKYELPYPLSIGILKAGNWSSSVPNELVAEGRLGVALGEAPEQARQEMEEALAEVCSSDAWLSQHPVQVEWFGGQFASGQTAPEHPIVKLVSKAHSALTGNDPEIYGATYGSDLRLMTELGQIPTIHYGAGSVHNAHTPDEYVDITELEIAAKTLIVTILHFCGYEK